MKRIRERERERGGKREREREREVDFLLMLFKTTEKNDDGVNFLAQNISQENLDHY